MTPVPPQLQKYIFKKGNKFSAVKRNRTESSMKEFARRFLLAMTDEEKIKFMNSLDPDIVWRMAEGNPANNLDVDGEIRLPLYLPSELLPKNDLPQSTEGNSK